ncbi:MAG TPA: prenyltransferase, partial [Archaeoglobus profundus]|nr:prenyltransferase [Archaeoglobus profundus]
NAYIAFTMAAPFIFGGIIANKLTPQIIVLSIIAFISGIAREIMKGIEDVEGDALRNVKSLARVKGVAFAAKISALLFLIAVMLSVIPFLFIDEYRFDIKYIVPVILTDIILIKVCLNLIKRYDKSSIREYRNQTLIALLFGLIGFLIGAID